MREVTATGQTVDEAVESALAQLGTTRESTEITIVDEGKKGLLGLFGNKPAIVKVTLKPDAMDMAKSFLIDVLKNMDIDAEIEVEHESDRNIVFNISGDKMGLLIGKRGQTLNSLQYLTQLVANRYSEHYVMIILDPENYRARREQTLIQLAERLAAKAIRTGRAVQLEPMPNYERKIIHTALVNNRQITTESEGKEPNRYLMIRPVK